MFCTGHTYFSLFLYTQRFSVRWNLQGKTGSAWFWNMESLCYYPTTVPIYSFSLINLPVCTYYLLTYIHCCFIYIANLYVFLTFFKLIYREKATLSASFWWFFCFYTGNWTWLVVIPPYSLITSGLRIQNNYSAFLFSWSIQLELAATAMLSPVCSSPPAELGWPRGNSLKEFIIRIGLAD